jgi:glycosyltransferase 2 family protein
MPKFFKRVLPLLWLTIGGFAVWVLVDRLGAIEFADIARQFRSVPVATVLAAALCAAALYTSVGLYEGFAVRLVTGRNMFRHALRTALIASPLGRALGVAMVSAGALRYRLYAPEGLSVRQVGAIVVLAAMPYAFGLGWLVDLSLLLNLDAASRTLQLSMPIVAAFAILGLSKDIGWLVLVWLRKRPLSIRGQSIKLPSLRVAVLQIALGLAQISLMSAILYAFMPVEVGMSWPAFIVVYCIAFVAGQLSNVPVGLGVLEAALLLMLPHVPPAKLLGSVLAYRAVYEVAPLLIALALLGFYEMTHRGGVIRRRWSGPV